MLNTNFIKVPTELIVTESEFTNGIAEVPMELLQTFHINSLSGGGGLAVYLKQKVLTFGPHINVSIEKCQQLCKLWRKSTAVH